MENVEIDARHAWRYLGGLQTHVGCIGDVGFVGIRLVMSEDSFSKVHVAPNPKADHETNTAHDCHHITLRTRARKPIAEARAHSRLVSPPHRLPGLHVIALHFVQFVIFSVGHWTSSGTPKETEEAEGWRRHVVTVRSTTHDGQSTKNVRIRYRRQAKASLKINDAIWFCFRFPFAKNKFLSR